ncbi:YfcE family phosphodiesterase [Candidatus Thorarchaeota archaeon]|jgi:vacuolar protein sorting-associated protein 29|nr:MAG: YfcE family phosphodiesterase [Candidatus Thorarchaeota archaeon]
MTYRVLVLGDAHMPSRRDSIPKEFYQHIKDTVYDIALITGDLVRESDFRAALPPLPRSFIVVGNMDYGSLYNFHEQIQLDDFNFLLLHGTQLRPRGNIEQLWEILIKIGGDVAVHGHTHKAAIGLHKEKLFLNPGTVSGATGGWGGRTDASFIELEIKKNEMKVSLHQTDWRVVKKSEISFLKQDKVIIRNP